MVRKGAINHRKQNLMFSRKPLDHRVGDRSAGTIATIPDN